MRVRAATVHDVGVLQQLVRELAEYEDLLETVESTEDSLREALFGESPSAEALIAEADDSPAGFALFFQSYSTFLGRPKLYLEDLYVRKPFRGQGIGRALLRAVCQIARDRKFGKVEWVVLDWNTSAIEFYNSLGAEILDEWRTVSLGETAMERLAQGAKDSPTSRRPQ